MVNTGYVLLDCKGIDLAKTSITIEGIYRKALAALDSGKVIYLTNIVNGTVSYSPMPVYGSNATDVITFNAVGKTITINNTNLVTIA